MAFRKLAHKPSLSHFIFHLGGRGTVNSMPPHPEGFHTRRHAIFKHTPSCFMVASLLRPFLRAELWGGFFFLAKAQRNRKVPVLEPWPTAQRVPRPRPPPAWRRPTAPSRWTSCRSCWPGRRCPPLPPRSRPPSTSCCRTLLTRCWTSGLGRHTPFPFRGGGRNESQFSVCGCVKYQCIILHPPGAPPQ